MSKIITVDLSEGQIGRASIPLDQGGITAGAGHAPFEGARAGFLRTAGCGKCGHLHTGPFYRKHGAQRHQGPYHVKGRGEKGALCFQYHRRFPQKLASLDIASLVVTGKI